MKFPIVLGSDCAGIVSDVGPGVTSFQVGDRVFTRPDKFRCGTFAEKIAVRASEVSLMPKNLDFDEAASLPLVALTAWQALVEVARVGRGDFVLIQAGAGGVGTAAIQIAKHLGARVATTASAPKHDFLRELGADQLIDYHSTAFEEAVAECDVVLDTLGGKTLSPAFSVLKRGGVLVSISAAPDPAFAREWSLPWHYRAAIRLMSFPLRREARKAGVRYHFLFMQPNGETLGRIAKLVEEGAIKPVIDRRFTFDEAREAFAYAEGGRATGKVLILGV